MFFPRVPLPVRYSLLPNRRHGAYVLGVEDVRRFSPELHPLVQEFAKATSGRLRWTAPSEEALIEQQNRGYVAFTVRLGDELVGMCIARRLRDGAADAGMFIKPEHRKGWLAIELARYVQTGMAMLGAEWMTWECDKASGSYAIAEYLQHEELTRRYYVDLTKGTSA